MLSHSVGTPHRAQLLREIPWNGCYSVSKPYGLKIMKEKHAVLEGEGQAGRTYFLQTNIPFIPPSAAISSLHMFCFRRKKSAKQKSAPMSVPIVQTYTQSKGEVSYENSSSPSGTKRRYHNVENSQYLLPNDEEEVDRLHFQHWIVRHVQGGLNFCAPLQRELERGIDVLDVGTGPGTWILEMAKDYQASRFTGMDISDNWPHTIKPSNSHFVLANLNETLPFEDESFDYIHMRFLMMGLTEQQYIDGFTKIFKLLRPGGCFELGEVDVRFAFENSIWNTFLKVMMSSRGLNYAFIDGMHKSMENTGFINVESNYYRTPLGGWGGKLGRLSEEDTRHVYADFKEFLMKPLNMDSNQYDEAVEKEFKEFYRLHTKLTLIKFIGYKP